MRLVGSPVEVSPADGVRGEAPGRPQRCRCCEPRAPPPGASRPPRRGPVKPELNQACVHTTPHRPAQPAVRGSAPAASSPDKWTGLAHGAGGLLPRHPGPGGQEGAGGRPPSCCGGSVPTDGQDSPVRGVVQKEDPKSGRNLIQEAEVLFRDLEILPSLSDKQGSWGFHVRGTVVGLEQVQAGCWGRGAEPAGLAAATRGQQSAQTPGAGSCGQARTCNLSIESGISTQPTPARKHAQPSAHTPARPSP